MRARFSTMAPEYSIPEETNARAAGQLSQYYRARLDEQMRRQHIIDIKARKVTLEEQKRRPQPPATNPNPESSMSGRKTRQTTTPDKTTDLRAEFAYAPDTSETGITLKPSPKARGIFIDFMA